MKRIAAILIALALFFCTGAFALIGTDYPVWDGASNPENSLYGGIGSDKLVLEFDASSEYSNVMDGFIQACFFAFDAGEQNYLEMYLMLPESIASGDVFSSAGGGMSSISLYEVFKNSEVLYFAGQVAGFAYPDGSSYDLRISTVTRSEGKITVHGTLSGTLVQFNGAAPGSETLKLDGLSFNFTMPLSSVPQQSPAPEASTAPNQTVPPSATRPPEAAPTKAPKATMDPHPAFTLPPDYAIV